MTRPNHAPKAITIDKQLKALQMRRDGKDYHTIAKDLGYAHASGAYAAVIAALKFMNREAADEVRQLELSRLDSLVEKLMPSAGASLAGLQVVDRLLKIMDRRARLLGLDMPLKIAPTSPDGEKSYDNSAIIGRLLPELAAGNPPAETQSTETE